MANLTITSMSPYTKSGGTITVRGTILGGGTVRVMIVPQSDSSISGETAFTNKYNAVNSKAPSVVVVAPLTPPGAPPQQSLWSAAVSLNGLPANVPYTIYASDGEGKVERQDSVTLN